MKLKKGQYYYSLHGNRYLIYRCIGLAPNGTPDSRLDTSQPSFTDRERAREHVYRLNGWQLSA